MVTELVWGVRVPQLLSRSAMVMVNFWRVGDSGGFGCMDSSRKGICWHDLSIYVSPAFIVLHICLTASTSDQLPRTHSSLYI